MLDLLGASYRHAISTEFRSLFLINIVYQSYISWISLTDGYAQRFALHQNMDVCFELPCHKALLRNKILGKKTVHT